jgi:hypothetical protein
MDRVLPGKALVEWGAALGSFAKGAWEIVARNRLYLPALFFDSCGLKM